MITKRITKTFTKTVPVGFRCDICGREIELTSEYEQEYEADVSKHFAVLNYKTPSGGFSSDTAKFEVHCCSYECTSVAIKRVPFDGSISIPLSHKHYSLCSKES